MCKQAAYKPQSILCNVFTASSADRKYRRQEIKHVSILLESCPPQYCRAACLHSFALHLKLLAFGEASYVVIVSVIVSVKVMNSHPIRFY